MGVEEIKNGKVARGGGIEWTIRDGVPFHVPTISAEIRQMVADAKRARPANP